MPVRPRRADAWDLPGGRRQELGSTQRPRSRRCGHTRGAQGVQTTNCENRTAGSHGSSVSTSQRQTFARPRSSVSSS